MAILINASIDLAKIDKSKITEKDGKKWLSLTIGVNNEFNDYGQNVSIQVSQSKEEKDSGQPKVYLGNGKVVWTDNVMPNVAPKQAPATPSNNDDDFPF